MVNTNSSHGGFGLIKNEALAWKLKKGYERNWLSRKLTNTKY